MTGRIHMVSVQANNVSPLWPRYQSPVSESGSRVCVWQQRGTLAGGGARRKMSIVMPLVPPKNHET